MARATIFSGICGFTTEVHARGVKNAFTVQVSIKSTCPHIYEAAGKIDYLDAHVESDAKKTGRVLPKVFDKHCPHPACPVQAGIVKTLEVAAGLNLPQDAVISLSDN